NRSIAENAQATPLVLGRMSVQSEPSPTQSPLPVEAITHLRPRPGPRGGFVIAHADGIGHCDAYRRPLRAYTDSPASIRKLCCSPEGDRLAVCDAAGALRLLDVASGEVIWEREFDAQAAALQFASGGRRLIVVALFGSASLLDADSGRTLADSTLSDGI